MNERGALTPADGEDKIAEAIQFTGGRRAGTGKDKETSGGGGSGDRKKSAKMRRRQSKKKHKARRMQEVQVAPEHGRKPKRHKRSPSVNFHEWQQARTRASTVKEVVCPSQEDSGKVLADHIYNTICPPKPPEKLTVLVEMQGSPATASLRKKGPAGDSVPGATLIISELKMQLQEERARREAAEAKFQAISSVLGEMAMKVAKIVDDTPKSVQPQMHN